MRRLSCSRWWSCTSRKKLFVPKMSAYVWARRLASSYLSREDGLGDVAAQAGRHADQALGVLRQQVDIDARLVVEAVQVGGGDQLDEVAVALLVFAEQHQVVVAVGVGAGLVALLRDVHLAADDRDGRRAPSRRYRT